MNRAEQQGDVPAPRFGHTTTLVGGTRIVLFGGATGDNGRYTITSDTYALQLASNRWQRIQPNGPSPSARAAHAAACVDQFQLVIYGGATGGGSMSSDELYLLNFRTEDRAQWVSVPVLGATPGRRYGHSLVFYKPMLIVFGGSNGQELVNDIWLLDVEKAPFQWTSVAVTNTRAPPARVYHSADVCREGPAAGMMVVFGGRTQDNRSLRDAWGLRQHRDLRWDWVEAPTKRGPPPEARYQHSSVFYGSKLLVVGGRVSDVHTALPTSVYDTETCEWRALASVNRFRHSCWALNGVLCAYGGFDHAAPSAPTNDLQELDLTRLLASDRPASAALPAAQQPAARADAGSQGRSSAPPRTEGRALTARIAPHAIVSVGQDVRPGMVHQVHIADFEQEPNRVLNPMAGLSTVQPEPGPHHAFIDKLLRPQTWRPEADHSFPFHRHEVLELCERVLEIIKHEDMVVELAAPVKIYGDIHGQFPDLMRMFDTYKAPMEGAEGDIDTMCYLFLGDYVDRGAFSLEVVCLLFALKIRYPEQVYMIRGNHEDATINAIYGFRDECQRRLGENPDEPTSCWRKFNQVFEWLPCGARINRRIFCIHGGIGGSITSVEEIASLQRPLCVAQIPQTALEQRVTDLLWSDPTDSDTMLGVCTNETRDPDGSGRIVKFGPDRVDEFLEKNPPLSHIIRAHECVMDGFERFAGGKLVTIFSATDYCGHHKNAGALIQVCRDLTLVFKLIYPVDRTMTTWDANITHQRPPTPPRAPPRRADNGE